MYIDLLKNHDRYDFTKVSTELGTPNVDRSKIIQHIKRLLLITNYGSREAIAFLLSKLINADMKDFTTSKLSTDQNICGVVHCYFHEKRPIFVMKYAQKESDNDDIAREFFLTSRFLNPLRVLTPNFMYAYHFIPKSSKGTKHKALYEHVQGTTLKSIIKQLSVGDIVGILLQVFLSLHIAQEACMFTHYDLHDENILLSKQPFEHCYMLGGKKWQVKCNYKVTIIDNGYAFVAGCGMGNEPYISGIERLEKAGVRKDMFSHGFDIIKLLCFVHYRMRKNKVIFPPLQPLFDKYALSIFPQFEKGKDTYYSINYNHPFNILTPRDMFAEICKLTDSEYIMPIDEFEYNFTPPEFYMAPLFVGIVGNHYQTLLSTSRLNYVYSQVLLIYRESINALTKNRNGFVMPPLASKEDDDINDYAVENITTTTIDPTNITIDVASQQMSILVMLSCLYTKDWKLLNEFRGKYYHVSHFNSKRYTQHSDFKMITIEPHLTASGDTDGETDTEGTETDEEREDTDAEGTENDGVESDGETIGSETEVETEASDFYDTEVETADSDLE